MNFMTNSAKVTAELSADTEFGAIVTSNTQEVTIDLNGKKLTLTERNNIVSNNSKLTITDNTLQGYPTEQNLIMAGSTANKARFKMVKEVNTESDATLTLKHVYSNATATDAFIFANVGKVNIDKCNIVARDYVTSTNAKVTNSQLEYGSGVVCNITNSSVTAETPIMMNVPMTMTISNTTIGGLWQCAMVRGGTLSLQNCTLNYTRPSAFTESVSWTDGNNVPKAAIMGGTKGTGAYQYPTSITIDNQTQINMLGTNNQNPKIYLFGDGLNTVTYTGPWSTANGDVMIGTGSGEGKVTPQFRTAVG